MTTDLQNVTVNADYFGPGDGVYVIATDGGYSCLGFDVCLDRIERYALDLYRDEVGKVDVLMAEMRPQRGKLEVYAKYRELSSALIEREQATGERSVADLSPQLEGLEGRRVEVVRMNGETARFQVGKSTGPIPIHLEVARSDSMGGLGADREYQSVRVVR